MASISLPRVLSQRRGGPIEVERENFWKAQAASINKAINNQETPVKEKHVRSAIIGTYHERGASTFWTVVQLLPLQGNPIVCWKFCHTLHKLLREGHPNVIPESRIHKSRLIELGKYWNHLKDSIGKLIFCYCNVLANRLDFHSKNPKFPGNLQLNDEQLESIGEMDINNFFQISVEMFDYMDEILSLQNAGLPPDILIGHRDRFYKQFKVLQEFYKKACVLQYFKHLIQIPPLPEEPPNFLVKSDLSSHISPVVILPPQEDLGDNDSVDLQLVDMSSIPNLLDIETTNGSVSPDLLSEKDQIIEHLRREIEELKYEIQRLKVDHQKIAGEFQQQAIALEALVKDLQQQLSTKQQEIDALQTSMSALAVNSTAAEKLVEAEQKCKANEVKFNKMKEVYNKLREEHIVLLRAKADVEKQFNSAKQVSQDTEKTKSECNEQLAIIVSEKEALQRIFEESVKHSTEQLDAITKEKEMVQREKMELEEKFRMALSKKSDLDQAFLEAVDNVAKHLADKERADFEKKELEQKLMVVIQENLDLKRMLQEAKDEAAEQLASTKQDAKEKLQTVLLEKEALTEMLQQTTVQSAEQLAEMMQIKDSLQKQKSELQEQLQRLTIEKTGVEQLVHKNAAEAAEQITVLTQGRAQLEQEKMVLEEKLATIMHEKSNMEKQLHQNMSEAAQKLDELGDENKEFDELLFQAVDEKYVVEQKLAQISEEYERQLAELTKERNELQVKVAEMEASLATVSYEKCTSELALLQTSENQMQQINELSEERRQIEEKVRDLEEQLSELSSDKAALQLTVSELKDQVERLESEIHTGRKEADDERRKIAADASDRQFVLLVGCLEEAETIIQKALDELDNPIAATMSCPPEYLLSIPSPLLELLDTLWRQNETYHQTNEDLQNLLKSIAGFSHFLGHLIIQGKAAANVLPDIDDGDKLTKACRKSGEDALLLLTSLKIKGSDLQGADSVERVRSDITAVRGIAEALMASQAAKAEDQVEDLVERELADMDRAIEEAANRIAQILTKSREAKTGVKLEVSEKILDACTALMRSIKVLVQRSKALQQEIVDQGRGSATVKEFYKRNHQWTDGLLSAAKAVGIGAKFLVDAADKVVNGQAKFETLMAASQEIAASTAQLVVASKVKAAPSSENLQHLSKASTEVRGCTGTVVATVKDCAQMMEDSDVMDFESLTLHQAKRLEMESQVRVLELENSLEKERIKLSALRKKHYAMAGPGEGWEPEDQAN